MRKRWHEKIIDEIVTLIKDTLIVIYNFDEYSLKKMRKCCLENYTKRYKPRPYKELVEYVKEAIKEIQKQDHMYDFRDIEE